MQEPWTLNVIWWITAVEIPTMAGLFWFNWRTRRDADEAINDARHEFESGLSFVRENLEAYKLDVAKSYASIPYLKEVERRLTAHLVRIENKLDGFQARTARGGPS